MFSQFARKVEIKHIYNTLYTVYTRFPIVFAIFANVLTTRSWERVFMTFDFFFMAYHHLA